MQSLGKPVFGVPLEVATKQTRLPDGVELPRVFREGIVHIEENCKSPFSYSQFGFKWSTHLIKQMYNVCALFPLQSITRIIISPRQSSSKPGSYCSSYRIMIMSCYILGDPGAVSQAGRKGATKVFNHGRKSPWVPTLTGPFPNGEANAGSWLGTKNALYCCAQSANNFS